MEKLSIFDFVTSILQDGTFLIIVYLLLYEQVIACVPGKLSNGNIVINTFLVIFYLIGHLLSVFGKKIEKCNLGMKPPWINYIQNNPVETANINKISNWYSGDVFFKENNNAIDVVKCSKLYDKIYNYLVIHEKDKKIKILISKYAFFRNSLAMGVFLSMLFMIFTILQILNIGIAKYSISILIDYSSNIFAFAFFSMWLFNKRLLLTIGLCLPIFFLININSK